jgi:phosphoribosylanthranilate isomerase
MSTPPNNPDHAIPLPLLQRFLDPARPSLKICGVTRPDDARMLADLGIDALGVNFWPRSKRHIDPESADWLAPLAGRILRVGVFVNAPPSLPLRLVAAGLLDLVQLHGDESPADAAPFLDAGVPFIKAIGAKSRDDLAQSADFGAAAILLDAHAPGLYGGTGASADWSLASDFMRRHPSLPLILAGGIAPDNAAAALAAVRPAALDVASGAESAPGIKDFAKIKALIRQIPS